MLKLDVFSGINNVQPELRRRVGTVGGDGRISTELDAAMNVDIDDTGGVEVRPGLREVAQGCFGNIRAFGRTVFATDGEHLVAVDTETSAIRTVFSAIGPGPVWYEQLPSGRVVVSNGLIAGTTDGADWEPLAVVPPGRTAAVFDKVPGSLIPGQYHAYLSYRRERDGAESPLTMHPNVEVLGGIRVVGLPQKPGFSVSVYLSSESGQGAYLLGTTDADTFEWTGTNAELVVPSRTVGMKGMPPARWLASWRGRLLGAQGSTLVSSLPHSHHLSDWREFKPFEAEITAVIPVAGGVYVGTEEDLFFLSGDSWDQLSLTAANRGPVCWGSGVSVPASAKQGTQSRGGFGFCIAGGAILSLSPDGEVVDASDGRYRTEASKVSATFRVVRGVPQYVAVPL